MLRREAGEPAQAGEHQDDNERGDEHFHRDGWHGDILYLESVSRTFVTDSIASLQLLAVRLKVPVIVLPAVVPEPVPTTEQFGSVGIGATGATKLKLTC